MTHRRKSFRDDPVVPEFRPSEMPNAIKNITHIIDTAEATTRPANKKWYRDDPNTDQIGIMKKMLVLKEALKIAEPPIASKQLAFALYDRLKKTGCLPRRKGGRGRSDDPREDFHAWDPGTVGNWLADRGPSPSHKEALVILDHLIQLTEKELAPKGRRGPPIADIFRETGASPVYYLWRVLYPIHVAEGPYTPPDNHKSVIAGSFQVDLEPVDPRDLQEAANKALDLLTRQHDCVRLVSIKGPPDTGRKMVLQFFLKTKAVTSQRLTLRDGSRLPILAVPLDEFSPTEFVNQVYDFYISAFGPSQVLALPEDTHANLKIGQIRGMARMIPACVLVSDITSVDADEIVRQIDQDYVGDVLVSIIHGHPLTRMLVTTTEADETLHHEVVGRTESISLAAKISLPVDSPRQLPGVETKCSRKTWRLAFLAETLIKMRFKTEAEQNGHLIRCHLNLEANGDELIVDHIWKHLLNDDERLLVGLIASSHEGIYASVLPTMLSAFKGLDPDAWPHVLSEGTDIQDYMSNLGGLIQIRTAQPNKTADDLPRSEYTRYLLDDGWRRDFVRMWFKYSPRRARIAQWLIAREAATQSRRLRIFGTGSGVSTAFKEDIRALRALIASIDPDEIRPYRSVQDPAAVPVDDLVLPPLDKPARMPDPTAAFRYAYLQLFMRGLDGERVHHVDILYNATLRLSMLLPFFTPHEPWQRLDERTVKPFDLYPHLARALSPKELIDLLTTLSFAALRGQRFDIIRGATRLGEKIAERVEGPDCEPVPVLRLLRIEVDAGILLGCNPDAVFTPPDSVDDTQMKSVVKRIRQLIESRFCRSDRSIEHGKLLARLGEALFLAGCKHLAGRAFNEAAEIERALVAKGPPATVISPVLGGRGARRYLRYLLEMAKIRKWRSGGSAHHGIAGLAIPMPVYLPRDDPSVVEARRFYEVNLRRLNSGRVSDRLAMIIDGARLAAINHDYAEVLRLLEAAGSGRFGHGSGIEPSVELMAVRVQFLLDAAALTLAAAVHGKAFASYDQACAITDYCRSIDDREPASVALLKRARDNLDAFNRIVNKPGRAFRPYAIFGRLMDLRHRVMACRVEPQKQNVQVALKEILPQIDCCIRQMRLWRYRAHLAETLLLRQCVSAAVPGETDQPWGTRE